MPFEVPVLITSDRPARTKRYPSLKASCARLLVRGVFAVFALNAFEGCGGEQGVEPRSDKYNAIFITTRPPAPFKWAIRVLDMEADTIIGEIIDPGGLPRSLTSTSDGKYAAFCNGSGPITVIELQTLAYVRYAFSKPTPSIQIIQDEPMKVFAGSLYDVTPTVLYDISSQSTDTVLPETSNLCLVSPDRQEFVTITGDAYEATWDGVTRRAIGSLTVLDSFRFVSPATQGNVKVQDAALSPTYDAIYILGRDAGGSAVFRYRLSDRTCTYRHPLRETTTGFALSPNGGELWVVQSDTILHGPPGLGYILLLEARTGVALDTISTVGSSAYYPNSPFPLTGSIAFHPSGMKVYAGSHRHFEMLVIDCKSRAIARLIDVGGVHDLIVVPK